MTVSEVIEHLSRFSGDLEVWTEGPTGQRPVVVVYHAPATMPPPSVPGGEREAKVWIQ
jgi:hypothetical protein